MENIILQKPKASPKDVFLHLLNIGMLFAAAISFISLIFAFVDYALPDPVLYGISPAQTIRWSLSVLIVVFPVYVWILRKLERDISEFPEKKNISIRRWLLNFTLFAASIAIITDLITLLYNYLGGELTLRFALKILVVFVVAVVIFTYYIWDIKRNNGMPTKMKWLGLIAVAMVLVSIVAGFIIAGSPQNERLRRFDEQRVNDLQSLQYQIINYWQRKEILPNTLDALADDISGFYPPSDPETKTSYEYRKLGKLNFELCATFALASDPTGATTFIRPYPVEKTTPQSWSHEQGRTCFSRSIDPELYPQLSRK